MSEGKIIYLEDRSGAELDDKCGMAYWWNRIEGERGIVPAEQPFALKIGSETHEDLHFLAKMEDIRSEALNEVVEAVLGELTEEDKLDQKKMELLYRRLGWFIAFGLYVEPTIRARYKTIQIEDELVLNRDPLWVSVTPDRVLEGVSHKKIEYLEYKTTISASSKWLGSWLYAIQLQIGMRAIAEEIKKDISFAAVLGLMKGYYSQADNHLNHPYVWGYYNANRDKWTSNYYEARSAEWVAMPVWEFPGGFVKWVETLGPEIGRSQFPRTPPVFPNEGMLDKWVERRLARQRKIHQIKELARVNDRLKNLFFESRTSHCRPAFGDHCPYLQLCWNAELGKAPLMHGDFIPRQPHHQLEVIGVEV